MNCNGPWVTIPRVASLKACSVEKVRITINENWSCPWPDILTKKIVTSLTRYLDKKIAPSLTWYLDKKNCPKFDLISWQKNWKSLTWYLDKKRIATSLTWYLDKKWHKFCKRLTASCQLPRTFTVILWEDNKLLYYCTTVQLTIGEDGNKVGNKGPDP